MKHGKLHLYKPLLILMLLMYSSIMYAQQVDVYTDETEEDNGKRYFNKKWEGDTISLYQRSLPTGKIKKMKEDDDFWYADKEFTRKERQAEMRAMDERDVPISRSNWFQTLLWIVIIGGFAAAVMWFLASSKVGLFRKKDKKITSQEEEELLTEDIFAINYQKEIDKAAQQGNYRLAIRLMFLRLLKNMSEKNIIQYKQDRTNLDYLFQLQSSTYYDGFFRITRNYEYAWYGLFDVTEDAYSIIKSDFARFERFVG